MSIHTKINDILEMAPCQINTQAKIIILMSYELFFVKFFTDVSNINELLIKLEEYNLNYYRQIDHLNNIVKGDDDIKFPYLKCQVASVFINDLKFNNYDKIDMHNVFKLMDNLPK